MSYITREDGEFFVIPSYRDVISAKNKSTFKSEILALSQNYGEYIALQRKPNTQYEVAFSQDPGYLLGETVWHHFKRPLDMIYCEALPDGLEAILVIVKAGSVYLDGSFSIDTIPEELVIFLTQQNNFEIYTYGAVPITETPQEGTFSFGAESVKSFTVLDKPVFSTLPLLRIYQLRLVDPVLKEHGIGVFPIRQLLTVIVIAGLLWMGYYFIQSNKEVVPQIITFQSNPLQKYIDALNSPAPDEILNKFIQKINLFLTMPGWFFTELTYENGAVEAKVQSKGSSVETLLSWAAMNNITSNITQTGFILKAYMTLPNRPAPTKIYDIKEVIAVFVDDTANVYPGNHLKLGNFNTKAMTTTVPITVDLDNSSILSLSLLAQQFKDMPYVIKKISILNDNGVISGSLNLEALGS